VKEASHALQKKLPLHLLRIVLSCYAHASVQNKNFNPHRVATNFVGNPDHAGRPNQGHPAFKKFNLFGDPGAQWKGCRGLVDKKANHMARGSEKMNAAARLKIEGSAG
jgi:hypothetical protein